MALAFDQINAITERFFVKKLADNIFDSNPLTKRLKEKSMINVTGGVSIMQPLNYATTSASGWYSGADTLSTTDNDQITSAEYTWKQHYANITIAGLDEAKNSGPQAMINFAKEKTKIAEKTLVDNLGTGVYSAGTDPKSIVGLRNIVGTANTIGGIAQGSNSWWQGIVDSSTTTLTLAAMQAVYNSCSIDADHPTVVTASRTVYNLYYALLQPQQRFTDTEVAKGGFTSVMFNGIPVIADSKCPSAHMFMINENYLHLYVHKDYNMKFIPFQSPINQDVRSAKILWYGALGSSNNRLHGKLSAIAA